MSARPSVVSVVMAEVWTLSAILFLVSCTLPYEYAMSMSWCYFNSEKGVWGTCREQSV